MPSQSFPGDERWTGERGLEKSAPDITQPGGGLTAKVVRGAFSGPHRETTDLSGRVSRLMRRIHDPVHQVSMPRCEISGHVGLDRPSSFP